MSYCAQHLFFKCLRRICCQSYAIGGVLFSTPLLGAVFANQRRFGHAWPDCDLSSKRCATGKTVSTVQRAWKIVNELFTSSFPLKFSQAVVL